MESQNMIESVKNFDFSLEELEKLKSNYGTPYYLYDGDKIRTHSINYINTMKKYFDGFKQFFPVKSLPNLFILKLLKDCGMGFYCSSPEEIKLIRFIDNQDKRKKKSQIFYTSNFTSSEDIKFALEQDCLINLDDLDGLDNMINSGYKIPEQICFRYNPSTNTDDKLNNFVCTENKFGMDTETITEAYEIAKSLGIEKFGLHSMCLTNELNVEAWEILIKSQLELVSVLKKIHSIQINFINIGGGIGIPYKSEQNAISISNFAEQIKKYFDKYINEYKINWDINIYSECGRYITGPFGYLVSSCKSIKRTSNKLFYGLDSLMGNLTRHGICNFNYPISLPKLSRLSSHNNSINTNIVGTLSENNDWLCLDHDLPEGINKGDLFVIHNVGSYTFSMGFNYNFKLKSPELLKLDGQIKLIRKRDKFIDLFRNSLYLFENENDINIHRIFKFFLFVTILLNIGCLYFVSF